MKVIHRRAEFFTLQTTALPALLAAYNDDDLPHPCDEWPGAAIERLCEAAIEEGAIVCPPGLTLYLLADDSHHAGIVIGVRADDAAQPHPIVIDGWSELRDHLPACHDPIYRDSHEHVKSIIESILFVANSILERHSLEGLDDALDLIRAALVDGDPELNAACDTVAHAIADPAASATTRSEVQVPSQALGESDA